MKLHSLLNEDLILLHSPHHSKAQATQALLDRIIGKFHLESRRRELESLLAAREALGGTSFPSGLAVPHARVPGFEDLIIAVSVPATPFTDGTHRIHMVVLILTSENHPTLYLNSLAAFVKMSTRTDLFQGLLDSRHPSDFIRLVEEQQFPARKDILVGDLMSPIQYTVTPETPLKAVIDLMFEKHFSYIPVVDSAGNFVGEIRTMDIIELGIPDYVKQLGSIKFTTSLEPFEQLLAREHQFKAGDLVHPAPLTLTPTTSLVEAALGFSRGQVRQLVVLDGKRVVGVLSYMDIFNKIFRE